MYTIRYATKKGGSGMNAVATNEKAKEELMKLFEQRLPGRVEKNGIVIGEVYKSNGKWNWYIDADA